MTDDEKTAALVCYALTCLAWVCREDTRTSGEGGPWFYEWVTTLSYDNDHQFGAAVLWAMRYEDEEPSSSPEGWLSYLDHVVGYRSRRRRT